MPRFKEPYTIFPRKLTSGKIVYYYRTYSPNGERTVAHSTGQPNKTQAKIYCAKLLADGLLYNGNGISFGLYAKNFFAKDSDWYADKVQTSIGKEQPVADKTFKSYNHACNDILIPYFQKQKLCDIKPSHIKKFRSFLIENGYSNASINLTCTCLRIIFSYAIADKIMIYDPFISIGQMYINARKKDAFTTAELKSVFTKWNDTKERKYFSLVAAVTGMRIGEISAIRKETLNKDFIDVKDQKQNGKLVPVKDGEKRKVRICPFIYNILSWCIKMNGKFAFKENQDTYRQSFYRQLGFSETERIKKKLSFHSLRHFCNTYLLTNNISEIKVKSIMGHSSGKGSMTERYANFLPEHFDDIEQVQIKLLEIINN